MALQELQDFNHLIGLANPSGEVYQARAHKPQQLLDYYTSLKSLIKKLSTKRTLYLYDCGCGRSYLSFYLNFLLQKDGIKNVEFICIDSNEKLIEECQQTAKRLAFDNMTFKPSDIIDFDFPYPPDIVYSLHACDQATDQMIFKAMEADARFIMSVSCCQHSARNQMKRHPLAEITRHKPYKERLVDMVADSMRALLLEASGYKVGIFEFSSTTYTDKNIMLKCERVQKTNEKAGQIMGEYRKLSELFNVDPKLRVYLEDGGIV